MQDQGAIYGLSARDMATLSSILSRYPDITEVLIFGSRAKGTHKPGSDIDLAVMAGVVTDATLRQIRSDIDDSSLPYTVDIVYYPGLSHTDLREHIVRAGLPFYKLDIR